MLTHESRQSVPWLIFDVGQKMQRPVLFLVLFLFAGCATSPYRIADRSPAASPVEVKDMRSQKQREGWSDRNRKFYALGDGAVYPDRVMLSRECFARSGARHIVLHQYDVHIFAGRSEGRSGYQGGGLLDGLVAGMVKGVTAPIDPMTFTDVAMISIALEIDGSRVVIAELEPFEGFSDMPVAKAAVKKANARALDRVRAIAERPNKAPEPTPMLGTSAAVQPLVPSTVVAHL